MHATISPSLWLMPHITHESAFRTPKSSVNMRIVLITNLIPLWRHGCPPIAMTPQILTDGAFRAFYREHNPWLQGWLRRRLGCTEQAADLAQDTYLQYLTSQPSEPIIEPRAYLTTLAKRVLFDFWRRRDLEHSYLEALSALPAQYVPSEEERALIIDTLTTIDHALRGVPPLAKQAFLLSQLYEMPYHAIADQLGISVMTVRRYMKQALTACCLAIH